MLLLISIGVGFSGNLKFRVGGYNAFLTIKAFLLLVIILILASLPELIVLFQGKNRKEVKHD